jgi:hypothetical protein
MKILFLLSMLFAHPAHASWHYNENSGIGIYQPEGWSVKVEGRSAILTGPSEDKAQSQIFLGSDWVSKVDSVTALKEYVQKETGDKSPRPIQISELPGFQTGSANNGSIHLLRINQNVIVIQYQLKGSTDQIDEGKTMLGSIEVRTKGNEQ